MPDLDLAVRHISTRDRSAAIPATLLVLSQDLLAVPEEQVPATRVELTVIAGEIVWTSGALTRPAGQE